MFSHFGQSYNFTVLLPLCIAKVPNARMRSRSRQRTHVGVRKKGPYQFCRFHLFLVFCAAQKHQLMATKKQQFCDAAASVRGRQHTRSYASWLRICVLRKKKIIHALEKQGKMINDAQIKIHSIFKYYFKWLVKDFFS